MKHAPGAKAKHLNSPLQFRALGELMKGPQSVRQLFNTAGTNGVPQLISRLCNKGLRIDTEDRQGQNRDGQDCNYKVYKINPASRGLAQQLLDDYATSVLPSSGFKSIAKIKKQNTNARRL
ncbi:hypothetical protein [Marinobacter sp. ELB17]|uniref:hypothetical protein n=1 Tax=Marinobacter sp. ELB17 TaxID=270374 RepID=UPI0000F380FB|nr:hypothetical protein [Marinobacter sp. ELB17]EBA00264.1 hypothetical protein MELB17_04072 [Marinobacter sp. ELB17]